MTSLYIDRCCGVSFWCDLLVYKEIRKTNSKLSGQQSTGRQSLIVYKCEDIPQNILEMLNASKNASIAQLEKDISTEENVENVLSCRNEVFDILKVY